MKKILYLLSIISLISCSDSFLERMPESTASIDNILTSRPNCESALNAIYVKSMFERATYYDACIQESRADNLNFRRDGYTDFNNLFDYNQGLADNGASRSSWIACYGIIDACNLIINNELTGLNDPNDPNSEAVALEKADYVAQARLGRAAAYLDLLSYYSRPIHESTRNDENSGVPLVLVNDYDLKPGRATTMEVYTQVYEDLIFASENLALDHDFDGLVFSKAYANGLLARFYMNLAGPVGSSNTYTFGDVSINSTQALENAISSCNFVLALVSPVTDFLDLEFGVARKLNETILMSTTLKEEQSYISLNDEKTYDRLRHCGLFDYKSNYGDILAVNTEIFDEFDENDKRLNYFYHPIAWQNNGGINDDLETRLAKSKLDDKGNEMLGASMFGKFAPRDFAVNLRDFFYNPADMDISYTIRLGDYNIMRASEIALIKAEACYRSNQTDLAEAALASVKQRYFDDALPVGITLNDILLEKRLELIGEGLRMLDLLRLGEDFSRYPSTNSIAKDISFDDSRMILPLPDQDVLNNVNLVQNPGYEN